MKISVIIPAKNEAALLPACLAALQAQRRPADEIIVVDNASQDATPEWAREFSVTVAYEPQPGIFRAAARGYSLAHGEVIARLDADSLPPPDWLGRIEAAFSAPQPPIAITGPGAFRDVNPKVASLLHATYMRPYFRLVSLAIRRTPLFGSNFAMTRATWLAARPQAHIEKQGLHDDIDLTYHLPKGRIHYLDKLTVTISARPFFSPLAMTKRVVAGFRTIFIHWPQQAPWNLDNQGRRKTET